ncbi:MAG: Na-translocating system protein MpsC family protein [Solirubrobacteraceae bacterium]
MSSTPQQLDRNGILAAAISNAMVGVLHAYTGRGPTRARTTIGDDLIVCVLASTLTRGEQSLVRNGKQDVVLAGRRAYQETMEADAIGAIQDLSGRRVVAFMSSNHIDPDLAVEVFILEPRQQATQDGDGNGARPDGERALPWPGHGG